MKQAFKINFSFIICLFLLISCSSDNDTSNELVLVKKIITVGNESENIEFIYQNNVLVKGISGNSTIEFEYSGNKIIQSKFYTNEVLTTTRNFVYDGDLLSSVTSEELYPERTLYLYQNNKLASINYEYFSNNQWRMYEKDDFIIDGDSNVIERENSSSGGGQTFTNRKVNSFDNKNNPLRDMSPYLRLFINLINIDEISKNNVLSYDSFSPSNNTTSVNYNYEIEYNSDNFPIKIQRYSSNGELLTTTTIEYQ